MKIATALEGFNKKLEEEELLAVAQTGGESVREVCFNRDGSNLLSFEQNRRNVTI